MVLETIFCCQIFTDHLNATSQKGLAIIPVEHKFEPNTFIFFLQARNLDLNDDSRHHTIIDQAIQYCPWCGKELGSIAKTQLNLVSEMANKNGHLVR